jgi:hypothetical protein
MGDPSTTINDEALIRVLGEYTAKAASAHLHYTKQSATYIAFVYATTLASLGVVLVVTEFGALNYLFFGPALVVFFLVTFLYWPSVTTPLELAVWQLRRIYELVSRREDLGVTMDSGTRLELELRLSEAQFILAQTKRFDRPEKFAAFQRAGPESPFRAFEPDDSLRRQPKPPAVPDAQNRPTPA